MTALLHAFRSYGTENCADRRLEAARRTSRGDGTRTLKVSRGTNIHHLAAGVEMEANTFAVAGVSVVQILLVVLASLTSAAASAALPMGGGSTELPIAQPGVRLSWVRGSSATDCPDASTVETDTVRRLGHNPFAQQPMSFIEAVVTREVESYRVTILMRDAQGKLLGSRVLTSGASDCRPLATAAALTIAILIDPDVVARSSEEAPPPAPAGPPPALPSTEPGSTPSSGGEPGWASDRCGYRGPGTVTPGGAWSRSGCHPGHRPIRGGRHDCGALSGPALQDQWWRFRLRPVVRAVCGLLRSTETR